MRKIVIGILCVVVLFWAVKADLNIHIGPEPHTKSTNEQARSSL